MRVLSLFDGMACGMLALIDAGIEIDRYVAYEIDKFAVKTSAHNFPMIEHMGNVFGADFSQYEGFDFLIGGSPCTYWSIAQKSNRETEASGIGWELFSQYVRALNEAQPKFFIYENNKSMSAAIRASISNAFGFDPDCINSSTTSAQYRQRLYWVGKRDEDGVYRKVTVPELKDSGITLLDVLDSNITGVRPINTICDKSYAIKANYFKSSLANFINGGGHYPQTAVAEPIRIGTWPNRAKNQTFDSQQYRIYSINGKSVTLCGNGGGMGAKTGLYGIPVGNTEDIVPNTVRCSDGKTYDVYLVHDGMININNESHQINLDDGYYIIRKLTVNECKRLQNVPSWYAFPVSDTQAYKMLGNGWTVGVISHLIKATQSINT